MSAVRLRELSLRLQALTVFRGLLEDPVLDALCGYLNGLDRPELTGSVSRYAQFVARLYEAGNESLAEHIRRIVNDSENPYIRLIGAGEIPSPEMTDCMNRDLAALQAAADLTPGELRAGLDWDGPLPDFPRERVDLAAGYRARCDGIEQYGYGIYARCPMFYMNTEGRIVPVRCPDPVRLRSLVGYEREQRILLDNTLALLAGKPAANILLTGDAGTGKSSTVKAVVNELYEQGLRILELRKEQLHAIPELLDTLNSNPLKFILFIDDLSFQKSDDNYSALKAVLEGSVSARSGNVVIYATSNRRHLVKESFSDREGDDVHRNDTVQELLSLSERFGIQITFQKPDKQTYLDIVDHLAHERGVRRSADELAQLAEQFALKRGGRSPRAAGQFIDSLLASEPE